MAIKTLLLGLVVLIASAGAVYVSPRGSDTTGSGSPEAPFLTLAKVASICQDGDVISLDEGLWSESPVFQCHNLEFRGTRGKSVINGSLSIAPKSQAAYPTLALSSLSLHSLVVFEQLQTLTIDNTIFRIPATPFGNAPNAQRGLDVRLRSATADATLRFVTFDWPTVSHRSVDCGMLRIVGGGPTSGEATLSDSAVLSAGPLPTTSDPLICFHSMKTATIKNANLGVVVEADAFGHGEFQNVSTRKRFAWVDQSVSGKLSTLVAHQNRFVEVALEIPNWRESDGLINDARRNWWNNQTGPSVCCNPRGGGTEFEASALLRTSLAEWCSVPDCTIISPTTFNTDCATKGMCPSPLSLPLWGKVVLFVFAAVFGIGAVALVVIRYRRIRAEDMATADRQFEAQVAEAQQSGESPLDVGKLAAEVMRTAHSAQAYLALLSFAAKLSIALVPFSAVIAIGIGATESLAYYNLLWPFHLPLYLLSHLLLALLVPLGLFITKFDRNTRLMAAYMMIFAFLLAMGVFEFLYTVFVAVIWPSEFATVALISFGMAALTTSIAAFGARSVWILREQITDDFGYSSLSQRATESGQGFSSISDPPLLAARKKLRIVTIIYFALDVLVFVAVVLALLTSCGTFQSTHNDSAVWVFTIALATAASGMSIANSLLTLRASIVLETPISSFSALFFSNILLAPLYGFGYAIVGLIEWAFACTLGSVAALLGVICILLRFVVALFLYQVRARLVGALHNIQPLEMNAPTSLGVLNDDGQPQDDQEIALEDSPSGDD